MASFGRPADARRRTSRAKSIQEGWSSWSQRRRVEPSSPPSAAWRWACWPPVSRQPAPAPKPHRGGQAASRGHRAADSGAGRRDRAASRPAAQATRRRPPAAAAAPTAAPTAAPAAAAKPAGSPKRGGELRIVQTNDFVSMDPIYSSGPTAYIASTRRCSPGARTTRASTASSRCWRSPGTSRATSSRSSSSRT